jgi:Uma2 family endonuclease
MYDLPSEDPQEPGLPDQFHDLQPQLLSETLRLQDYATENRFTGTDLNLYYDVRYRNWYKRPDWFLVVGVPYLYDGIDMRSSYVIWQEGVSPHIVVELLSPGTEKEDLGEYAETEAVDEPDEATTDEATVADETAEPPVKPPRKWEVYESILRIPYYVVFSRYTGKVRFFQLVGSTYQEQEVTDEEPRLWISSLKIGLGRWFGSYHGIERFWLRWYDAEGNWLPTYTEQNEQEAQRAEQETQRAEQEAQRAERLAARLRELGEDPDTL